MTTNPIAPLFRSIHTITLCYLGIGEFLKLVVLPGYHYSQFGNHLFRKADSRYTSPPS